MEKLKMQLSKFGNIEIIKEGIVFTVLITGTQLSNWKTVQSIQEMILEYAGEKYPLIEAMRNTDTFFCLILKPKK